MSCLFYPHCVREMQTGYHVTPLTPQCCCRVVEDCQSSPGAVEEITTSFFSLLESIFRTEGLASTLMVGTVVCSLFHTSNIFCHAHSTTHVL